MKKVFWLVAAMAAFSASQSSAQAKRFEGLSLGLNAEAVRSSAEQVTTGASASDTAYTTDGDIQLQYGWVIAPQFVLGAGATLGAGPLKAGTVSGTEFTVRDRFSVDIVPGYALSDSSLLYAKLSYLTATVGAQGVGINTSNGINGYGIGVGFRAFLAGNVYGQVAYDYNKNDDKSIAAATTLKSVSDIVSIGVGYRF